MKDSFLQMLADGNSNGLILSDEEAKQMAGDHPGEFKEGVSVAYAQDGTPKFDGVTLPAWKRFLKGLVRPKRGTGPRHFGNCTSGYSLELVGEDADYIVLRCVPEKVCYHILAKKSVEDAVSNGGFEKDVTVSQIVGENKYDS